jgi:tyrosine-protein kinase Etk/Wzc
VEGVDFGQFATALRKHFRVVALIAALVFVGVMVLTLSSPMEFRATGQLYLGELEAKSTVPTSTTLDISGGTLGDVGSEVEILRSRASVKRAVVEAGLNASLRPQGWRPPRYLQWLLAKRDPKLLDVAARDLTVRSATLLDDTVASMSFELRFVSDSTFELWQDGRRLIEGKLGERVTSRDVEFTLSPGDSGLPKGGAVYELDVRSQERAADAALGALKAYVAKGIGGGETVKVVTLEFVDSSPRSSALFLRRLMESYLNERQSWKSEDATAAQEFVTNQLRTLRESLDQTDQKLSDYRANSRVVVMENEAEAMASQIGRFEEQRVAARLQLAALHEMMRALKDPKARVESFLVGEMDDKVLSELASTLSHARQQLAVLEARFGAEATEVREQRAYVDSQLGMVRNYVTTRQARATENLTALNRVISQYEVKLRTVPGAELGLQRLSRDSEVYNRIYSYLLERQQQTAIAKASTISKNRILDLPQRPYHEDSPKLGLRLSSGVLGLLLGCLFVIVRHLTATTLQSESDVARFAGNVPILASIPVPLTSGSKGWTRGFGLYDVLGADASSPFAEAFRGLRANLYKLLPGAGGRVILVSSPVPGDGKTTTALALGAMLAADRKNVLVIDADVRKPTHHELLRTEVGPGLTEVLAGTAEPAAAVQLVSLSYGEMFSMSAGKAGGVELLISGRTSSLLAQLRSRFDVVILDVAAFPLTSDALALAGLVDAMLTVVRVGHTPRRIYHEHLRVMQVVAPRYAMVVNGVDDPMRDLNGTSQTKRLGLFERVANALDRS